MPKVVVIIILILASILPSVVVSQEERGLATTLRKDYYISKIRQQGHDFSAKLRYLDSLEQSGALLPGELMREKTDIYLSSGNYQKAVDMLSGILERNPAADTTLFALYNLAYCRQATGNYEKALEDIYRISVMDKPDSLASYQLYSDFILARIYRVVGRYSRSDTILADAFSRIPAVEKDSAGRYSLEYKWLLEKASAYLDEKNYPEALAALKKASEFDMDKESSSLVLMGMAELYHHISEAAIAEDYYKAFINESPSPINRLYALNNYCAFLVDQHRCAEAVEICRKQIDYADRNGVNHVKASLYGTLADALYALEDYKGAFEAHKKFYGLMDSVMQNTSPHIIRDYESLVKHHGEDSSAAPDGDHRQSYWPVIVLVVVALSLAAVVVWLCIRLRACKLDKSISAMAAVPAEDDSPSSGDDDERNREYLSLTLQLAEINQALENAYEISLDKDKSYAERRNELNAIWTAHCANRNFWELFRISFEKVHPKFLKKLYERHPDLSKGEVRMCSFIIMELATKDIAALTNRSVRTVESMKYRLTKKLNPPAGQSTEAYLRSLM